MLLMGLGKEKMERGQNAASIINESEKHVEKRLLKSGGFHPLAPVSVANLSLEQVFESLFEAVVLISRLDKIANERMKFLFLQTSD
jgi:hypothetical protein